MGEETENESESGDSVLQWAMRRREASDDDGENENSGREEREMAVRMNRRVGIGFGDESDGVGGAAEYGDDDDDDDGVSYIDELEALGEEVEVLEVKEEEEEVVEDSRTHEEEEVVEDSRTHEEEGEREVNVAEAVILKQRKEEKKSEEEPFVEPRIGAFYMHDDRFRGRRGRARARGRYRQTSDGRNLREFKDERKWRHDKFEELTSRETRYKEVNDLIEVRRTSEGHYQGQHKNQGRGRGYAKANKSKTHDNSTNQNQSLKTVRGRGPVKYKPIIRSSDASPSSNNRQSGKPPGVIMKTDSARVISLTSNVDSNSLASKKHVSASSARSALHTSPASSSSHDISGTRKRDVQPGRTNEKFSTSLLPRENMCVPQTHEFLLGNTATDSIGWDRLYVNESTRPVAGNYTTSMPLQSSMTWSTYTGVSPQFRGQGRGLSLSALLTHQSTPRQVNRVSQMAQYPAIEQIPVESTVQPTLGVNAQKLSPCSGSGSPVSSKAGILESLPESSRFGKGTSRASLPGGGILGDQNFAAAPALLPVMQFGGQYHGDLGDPALDMALAGYIAQSQVGFGTSELTWSRVPALPVAAGAVGAAHLPPYVTPDSAYNVHSSDKMPSLGVARNMLGAGKPSYGIEPHPDRTEIVNKQFGQRRIKPLRYSKMNFNQ